MRRYVVRPFQRYRIPLGILFMSLAVFAAIVVVLVWGPWGRTLGSGASGVPQEYRDLAASVARATPPTANATAMVEAMRQALEHLIVLQESPDDPEALLGMANVYLDLRDSTGSLDFARKAIGYYDKYLALRPDNNDARTDLAISLFYSGQTDRAIQEVGTVLSNDPSHLRANYNLGVFYRLGRGDTSGAMSQFEKVLELASADDPHAADVRALAEQSLAELQAETQGSSQEATQEGTQ
jgi:cytochrome c-type biogenesis protein CcmH/NrfG